MHAASIYIRSQLGPCSLRRVLTSGEIDGKESVEMNKKGEANEIKTDPSSATDSGRRVPAEDRAGSASCEGAPSHFVS